MFRSTTALALVFGAPLSFGQTSSAPPQIIPELATSTSFGSIHGMVTRDDGLSAIGTKIILHDSVRQVDTVVIAAASSEFRVASMPPGKYELQPVGGAAVTAEVVAGQDIAVNLQVQAVASTTPASPSAAVLDNGFFHRLGRAYVADWAGTAPSNHSSESSEKRRGTPEPLYSPPFPAGDWPIGGTPVIGSIDEQSYPLMQALDENKGKNKIFGWIEVGANGSTNNKSNAAKGIPSNFPSAYDEYANTVQLDQAALYFDKYVDTAQKDHFDWGYQLTLLYGVDYRFTTAHGILSQQLLVKNNEYGFDPVMFYFDFYVPHVAEGMNIRVGRYISLPDIEAQLAPNNYSYSHSILYTFDCYTQTGANATVKFSKHWTAQAGISGGCDTAPWTTDAKLTGNFCVQYTWHEGGDALYTCANSVNDGKYAYNNLAAYYETWYHRFNASWHTDTEMWYQYERQTPNMYWFNAVNQNTFSGQYAPTTATPWPETTYQRIQNNANAAPPVNLNFGAVCEDPRLPAARQQSRCYAPEVAITNYVEHNFWHNSASLNIRNEWVNDIRGQRTGTPAKYEEHMVGFDFWAGSTITFRPELSYTHAYAKYGITALNISPGAAISNLEGVSQGAAPNPLGLGKNQALTLAADLIWHF
jgi:hypothetical protein